MSLTSSSISKTYNLRVTGSIVHILSLLLAIANLIFPNEILHYISLGIIAFGVRLVGQTVLSQ